MTNAATPGQRTRREPGSWLARPLLINLVACLTLIAQFLLGMVVNLFVKIPDHHPGAHARNFFSGIPSTIGWSIPSGPIWLALHICLGLLLVVAGLANVGWAPNIGSRIYTAASVLAGLAILGAAFNGNSFVNYGHDFSSMIMACLWALALSCYLVCLYIGAIRIRAPTAVSGTVARGPTDRDGEHRE